MKPERFQQWLLIQVTSEDSVVVDINITTSRGLGTAVDFALSLISQLENEEKAKEIAESVVYTR